MTEPARFIAFPINTTSVTVVGLEPNVQIAGIIRGPKGDDGAAGGSTVSRTTDIALSGHRAVIATPGGHLAYPDITNPAHASLIEGVTTGASAQGASATVQISGEMVEPSWNWSLGPIFCGDTGTLTQTPPLGVWLRQIGTAVAADTIIINLQPPIITA